MLRTPSGLKYFLSGKGPQTVICHPSLGLGRFLFYRLIPPLSRQYTVITYDPRGIGENEALEPDLGAWVDDVGELMGIVTGPCHLMGVSLGTWVMSRAAVRWPERVAGLILMGTTPGFASGETMVQARREELGRVTMEQFARTYADGTLTEYADPEVKEQLFDDLKQRDAAKYLKAMAEIYLVDNRSAFAAIAAQTLIIAGAKDERTPPRMADEAGELIAHSTVRVLPNAGHLALLDQPERVQELVEAFLASREIDD